MAKASYGPAAVSGGFPVQAGAPTGSKMTFTLSNGNSLVLAPHPYDPTIYVYEVNAAHTTFTLRATITTPSGTGGSGAEYSQIVGCLHANNDLTIVIRDDVKRALKFCKFTYSGYGVSAFTTLVSVSSPSSIESYDADMSDADMLVVAFNVYNGSNAENARVITRTSIGVIQTIYNASVANGTIGRGGDACAVVCLGLSGGIRDIMVAHAMAKNGTDYGIRLSSVRVTEATGGLSGSLTLRQTLMSGEVVTTTTTIPGRLVNLYRTNTNEYTLIAAHSEVNRAVGVVKGTLAVGVWTSTLALQTSSLPTSVRHMATTFGKSGTSDIFGVITGRWSGTANVELVSNLITTYIKPDTTWGASFSTDHQFGKPGTALNITGIGSQGNRNQSLSEHDMTLHGYINAGAYPNPDYIFWAAVPTGPSAGNPITSLSPANGASGQTANPPLAAVTDIELEKGQSKYKVQFQFARDAIFSTSLVDYLQPDAKLSAILNTSVSGTTVTFGDSLPTTFTLAGGTWYYRARLVDEFGNVGAWTATNTITTQHPPVPVPVSPVDGQLYVYTGGGTVNFDWLFTDPSETDYQTAYQVTIYDAAGTTISTTGKVSSTVKRYTTTISAGYKDTNLSWSLTLWDSEDTQGPAMTPEFFVLTDAPSATVTAPASGATITTGVPTFTANLATGGGRAIREYTVSVQQAGLLVWSVRRYGPFGNTVSISEKIPQGYLNDGQDYSVMVSLVDALAMQGNSPLIPFFVDWVPPAAPTSLTINASLYNTEDQGYISIVWDDTARETSYFAGWRVYRKDDMIDPTTLAVVEVGDWTLIHEEFNIGAGYEYKDFFAPSNYKVSYKVAQAVNRDGQEIESVVTTPFVTYPQSDGYWLIEPDSDNEDADAFKLSIVTGDSFTDEQEEVEIIVIGRGRTVQKGQKTGIKGSLDCRLRNTGGTTARQKRVRLKKIQDVDGQLWLRNPFGDTFKVNVGNMSISRIAGVGGSEFVDVTIPYAEVN